MLNDFWINRTIDFNTRIYKTTPDGNIGLEVTDQSSIPDDPSVEIDGPSQIKIYLEGPNGGQRVMVIEYQ